MKHEIVTGLWRAWSDLYDVKYRADRSQITRKQVGSAISSLLLRVAIRLLTYTLTWIWQQIPSRIEHMGSHDKGTRRQGVL